MSSDATAGSDQARQPGAGQDPRAHPKDHIIRGVTGKDVAGAATFTVLNVALVLFNFRLVSLRVASTALQG